MIRTSRIASALALLAFFPGPRRADATRCWRVILPREARFPAPDAAAWFAALADFRIVLSCDGEAMDEGHSANVLGTGPLGALRHLVAVLAADPEAPPLQAGEIISTGTLTRALPVSPGQTWSTRLDGVALPGITVRLVD